MTTIEAPGLSVGRKIADLRQLQDGWRNGEGVAFDADYLAWLAKAFSRMYPADAPMPTICPTIYGIVSAEWSFADAECSLEIDPETREGALLWICSDDYESSEAILDMAKPEGWVDLVERLRA